MAGGRQPDHREPGYQSVSPPDNCRAITGTIFGNPTLGSYCPATGRIVFVRKTALGTPFQVYEGSVSQDDVIDRIGGSFMIWNSTGGAVTSDGPDYIFSVTK